MSFATFVIFMLVLIAIIMIVNRSKEPRPGPPGGQPCPNCGTPRGQVDRFCRRCGRQLQ